MHNGSYRYEVVVVVVMDMFWMTYTLEEGIYIKVYFHKSSFICELLWIYF